MRCIGGETLEKGAEFSGLCRHLRREVVLLCGVGAEVIELLTAADAVDAGAGAVVRDVFEGAAAQGIARAFECLGHEGVAADGAAAQQGRMML